MYLPPADSSGLASCFSLMFCLDPQLQILRQGFSFCVTFLCNSQYWALFRASVGILSAGVSPPCNSMAMDFVSPTLPNTLCQPERWLLQLQEQIKEEGYFLSSDRGKKQLTQINIGLSGCLQSWSTGLILNVCSSWNYSSNWGKLSQSSVQLWNKDPNSSEDAWMILIDV